MDSHHMRQLSFWGFKENIDKKSLFLETQDVSESLSKLVNFFNKEELKYMLTDSAKDIFKDFERKVGNFEQLKEKLRKFKEGVIDKASFEKFDEFLTKNLKRRLKGHQKKAAYHLYLAKNGANFSVPGSGKTSVVLAVYAKLKAEGLVDTIFVVGPPAAFGPWKHEFQETLGYIPKYQVMAGGDKDSRKLEYYPDSTTKSELYLTTFQTLLVDQADVLNLFRSVHVKPFLVIDEAHYIKKIDGNWANAILNIAESAAFRCVLTGTPLPKGYADIFNLFDFLWPDHHPIDNSTKHRIQVFEKENKEQEIKTALNSFVGPWFYRVRKSDLGLTEPLFHKPEIIQMNKFEKIVYDAIENKIRDITTHDNYKDIELVVKLRKGRLIRLRQAVSYTKLLKTAIENYDESLYDSESDIAKYIAKYDELELPAKSLHLIKMLDDFRAKNEKVIIWSNFIETIELLKKLIDKKGLNSKIIYGATPIEQTALSTEETREKIRNEFVDPRSGLDILIANPAACAESISLHTTCHNAVYYDLSYNCAQYLQSLDRIHRVGGSEHTFAHYYFLQYADTFEPDIKNNVEKKALKMQQLIDQDYNIYNLDMFEEDETSAYDRIFS